MHVCEACQASADHDRDAFWRNRAQHTLRAGAAAEVGLAAVQQRDSRSLQDEVRKNSFVHRNSLKRKSEAHASFCIRRVEVFLFLFFSRSTREFGIAN